MFLFGIICFLTKFFIFLQQILFFFHMYPWTQFLCFEYFTDRRHSERRYERDNRFICVHFDVHLFRIYNPTFTWKFI